MGAKNTSENVPIYVTVLLLHLKICANICKSIRNNIDETIAHRDLNPAHPVYLRGL